MQSVATLWPDPNSLCVGTIAHSPVWLANKAHHFSTARRARLMCGPAADSHRHCTNPSSSVADGLHERDCSVDDEDRWMVPTCLHLRPQRSCPACWAGCTADAPVTGNGWGYERRWRRHPYLPIRLSYRPHDHPPEDGLPERPYRACSEQLFTNFMLTTTATTPTLIYTWGHNYFKSLVLT